MSNDKSSAFHHLKISGLYLFLFILLILNLVDMPLFGAGSGKLAFLLVSVYFWTIYRPSLLPYPLVFCMGLLLDFLSGGLVGLYALCFLVMVMIVRGQRRYLLGQSWPVIWAGFCVAISVVMGVQYLSYTIAYGEFPPFIPTVFNLLLSSLLYPLFMPVMMAFNRMIYD